MKQRIAFTPGEPAGIGPDLAVMLAQQSRNFELVAIADPEVLELRARLLDLPLQLRSYESNSVPKADDAGTLCISEHATQNPVQAGKLDVENSHFVLNTLDDAISGCLSGDYNAMVTGPVHKGVINDAGIPFSGHTEYIAATTGGYPVMMLLTEGLRVALATTHIPVAKIAETISSALLKNVLTVVHADLQEKFGITDPEILVCGLNPHAGEMGHLGTEEIDTIVPVLEEFRRNGMSLTGPLPADTLFTPPNLEKADAVLAMYHDQGLPVLKYAGFGQAVNLTLGLPIIRTSVDHGTALDLAGTPGINSGSMSAALNLARSLSSNIS